MSDEVYYLHLEGEQRGPYTLRHLDHMLQSGLIPEDTTFVRDGMEQWLPITDLIALRRPKKRWKLRGALVAALVTLLILGRFFGPIAMEGWRETAQYEFTERAAYWRARDIVRRQALPPKQLVKFADFARAHVDLAAEPKSASVQLEGELTALDGTTAPAKWTVRLRYDSELRKWFPEEVTSP